MAVDSKKKNNSKKTVDSKKKVVKKTEKVEKELPKEEKTTLKDRPQLKLFTILFTIILLVLIIDYMLFPKISLRGDNQIILNYNDEYYEPGYSARMFLHDVSKKVTTRNDINMGKLGNYKIEYLFNYGLFTVKKERKIRIIDNVKPEIKLDSSEINVCPGKEPEPKFEAIDEYEGDLKDKVIISKQEDMLMLTVSDASNNVASEMIKVTYGDKEAPKITLKGNGTIYLDAASRYYEPGYTANDNCDGDISSKVKVEGSVGYSVGTYKLTYSVSDNEGNKGSATRTVIVRNNNLYNSGTINKGTVYLTFDDGPSEGTTNVILDILKEEGVKATFFVTCNGPDYLIKRMYDEGHTVALHTATHNYSYIYSSIDNYFSDLNKVHDRVKRITGIDAKIIRFPGGSSNTVSRNYQYGIMSTLTNMVLERGYRYFDWNVDSKDAGGAGSSKDVYYNVVGGLSKDRANVVLMHDIKWMTRDALRDIIKYGKQSGYEFKRIENDTYMVRHSVNN